MELLNGWLLQYRGQTCGIEEVKNVFGKKKIVMNI